MMMMMPTENNQQEIWQSQNIAVNHDYLSCAAT